jgi:hypothetical protein
MAVIARILMGYAAPLRTPVITNGEAVLAAPRDFQRVPPSIEYSYVVITDPPVFVGGLNATESDPSAGVTAVIAGAADEVAGVATEIGEGSESPISL